MTANSLTNVLSQQQQSKTPNNNNNNVQHKRTPPLGPPMIPLTMQQLFGTSQKQVTQKLSQQLPSQLPSKQPQNLLPAKKSPIMMSNSKNFFITSQAGPTVMSQQNSMYSFNDLASTSPFTKVSFSYKISFIF